MLSRLKYALPKEYNHVFVYLKTNEERNKSYDCQLATSKAMINSHYKTKIQKKDNERSSMLCMLTSDNKYGGTEMKCAVCGKKDH